MYLIHLLLVIAVSLDSGSVLIIELYLIAQGDPSSVAL